MKRWLVLPLLAAGLCAQAADPPLGRLFYTPAQRAALEEARKRNISAEEQAAEVAKRPQAPRPRNVIVTGVVQRSDGESFAWVNGKPVEGETGDGLRVRHTSGATGVMVYDPEKGRSVRVKVGQHADLLTGRIEESYERGRAEPDAPGDAETGPAPSLRRQAKPRKEREQPEAGRDAGGEKDPGGGRDIKG